MENIEKVLRDIKVTLSSSFNAEQIEKITETFIVSLQNYDLTEKCTTLAIRDNADEEIIRLYLGTIATEGKARSTIYAYNRSIMRFLNIVQKPIKQITTNDIRLYIAIKHQNVSKVSVANERNRLSAFFNWLVSEEFIMKNPMAKIKAVKFSECDKLPFSAIEIDKMRSNCDSLRSRAILEVLLSSGVRVTECSELNISDIDFSKLSVKIRHGKGDKSRITYISEVAKEHLINYLRTRDDHIDSLFISRQHHRLSKAGIEGELRNIGNKSNVTNVHPHRCRRTFATELAKKGMAITTIQALMGHRDINTTKKYITTESSYLETQARLFI